MCHLKDSKLFAQKGERENTQVQTESTTTWDRSENITGGGGGGLGRPDFDHLPRVPRFYQILIIKKK